ncbi:MAG TPA: hypothetical protein DCZ95_08550 [Verrucomicrobia bacterium]|nr:MAG: hypothetical protein A2X46_12585 [Lentisphaerae bacterium GWF2_57_35]HBA84128.1 hypothetical protein [Verrucomicrobiota bacterium]
MKPNDEWQSFLNSKKDEVECQWLTKSEFEIIINEILKHAESPLLGLQFSLEFAPPFKAFDIGHSLAEPPDTHSFQLDDNRSGLCRAKWWLKPDLMHIASVRNETLAALFKAWWKTRLRTPSAGLPDLKRDKEGIKIADETVMRRLEQGVCPSVLFCDLDNFGEVNKRFGQEEGNRVIKEFGALAEKAVTPFGILLHNGGDELVVLCPKGGALSAIRAAYAVRQAVQKYDFKVHPLTLGMSAGGAASDSPQRQDSFEVLKNESDQVLHNFAKKPTKGRTRFNPATENSPFADWLVEGRVSVGKCLVLSTISDCAPFGNAWLNALSALVQESMSTPSEAHVAISDFITWMGAAGNVAPMHLSAPPEKASQSVSTTASATALDLAFAIAHGILVNSARNAVEQTVTIKYSRDGQSAAVFLEDETKVWSSVISEKDLATCILPLPKRTSTSDLRTPYGAARAVLIKIGHSPLPVPACLFSEIIVVDDRPTRGGCLPDFWEVTIARLITRMHSDPNTCLVFVMGNLEHGGETVAKLKEFSKNQGIDEETASRLAVTAAMLRETAGRLNEKLYFPPTYEALSNTLAVQLDAVSDLQSPISATVGSRPLLIRDLRLDEKALSREDGCRVETAAEAFPIVLEILRNAKIPSIRDQAGRTVSELVDFKVNLRCPAKDVIPAYYSAREKRMCEYFDGAFMDTTKFFGAALAVGGQLDAVLAHIVAVIQKETSAFATRRAILVVPHDTQGKEELSPLGLVSVRIIPRFSAKRCELSYSFTWRTVEALVGFPYSLYGSICFGQELTRRVCDLLPSLMRSRVSMGQVSYLAHSLHMFMDDNGQAIVRHIVNEATA